MTPGRYLPFLFAASILLAAAPSTLESGAVRMPDLIEVAASRISGSRTIRVAALVNERFDPAALRDAGWRLVSRVGSVVTLQGRGGNVSSLVSVPGVTYVKMPDALHPSMDSARKFCRINEAQDNPQGALPHGFSGTGVLVAIFDTEFDTHHPAFLDSAGETRFVAVWDQRDTTQPHQNRYDYGIIKNHAGLEADTAFGHNGDFHGTLMASYAVGGERTQPFYGVATNARILGVQYAGTDVELIDALDWTFSVADSLGLPCVVNMSIGVAMGPHDGTSLLDRAIDSISGSGRIIVGAMGNDGDKRSHVAFPLSRNESRGTYATPHVYIDTPDTILYTTVDLWGDSGRAFSVRCRMLDTVTMASQQGSQNVSTTGNRTYPVGAVLMQNTTTGAYDTCYYQITVEQTSALNRKPHARIYFQYYNPRLVPGVVVTVPLSGLACTVHGWNDAKVPFRGFGQQGFYDGDSTYSVNEVGGTAGRIIAVGAYVNKVQYYTWDGGGPLNHPQNGPVGGIAVFSSRGPTIDGRTKPDITAPGSDVGGAATCTWTDPGGFTVWWPDTPSVRGRYSMGTGTSVSSPIVAGVIALMLQADPALTPEEVRTVLQETAITDTFTGAITTPDNTWGAGKVDALAAVRRVLGLPTRSAVTGLVRNGRPGARMAAQGLVVISGIDAPGPVDVRIFDCAGRNVLTRQMPGAAALRLPARLGPGIYTVQVRAGSRVVLRTSVNYIPR